MATVLLAGTVVTGAGVAVVGATVEVFDRDTTTPVRSTFTGGTDASGDWNFTYAPGANSRRVDVRVTNGASISFLKYDDQIQVSSVETANLRIINPAFTFEYDIVPAAITAARQLNLPLITATRTLVANNTALADNESIIFGTGADASILYDGTNLVVNPQLVGTGVFDLAAGILELNNAARWDTGLAVVAAAYSVGRDADGTNQLHLNVPTGATFELSVNDVQVAVLSATAAAVSPTSSNLTLYQGTEDGAILGLASSDVAHGRTRWAATDVYAQFQGLDETSLGGGLTIRAIADASATTGRAAEIHGISVGENTTKTTAARGVVEVRAEKADAGSSTAELAANGNLFAVRASVTKFVVDQEGDLFAGNATVTVLDALDDAALLRSYSHALARHGAKGLIQSDWDRFVQTNEAKLVDVGILGAPLSEGGLWNLTQHTRVLTGAAWQAVEDIMSVVQAVLPLLTPEQQMQLTPRIQQRLLALA